MMYVCTGASWSTTSMWYMTFSRPRMEKPESTEILENRQAYYHSKALPRLARGVAPVPADARTQEDKLERAITAFALLPTLRQRF
ncbi:hypothetical protein PF010_g30720 [Phytophthora fragariae]|uniref:Uncharacterized protein n=3 Tax=Phytophthora fragariae TaxID=53985 RepID=A0A6A3EJ44_9STRA|nr:hypothetical protein PF003_g28160 [Phytophthora fragariae]KAE8932513.1 hypothetical protein PF009_g17462 [Phytophthora fragariae]KAE9057799.1 hypothetical protein PF007_g31523 [Phytophthora fragariae]KAE9058009.1 hypothetical protein PF006_g32272 [Phytophthora fragariae]KAE9059189.1 hypothetical protein PF010_g30720 [Phytophthora fragariae]